MHGEMRHENGVVMLGTAELPKGSPGIYLVVEDVDAHRDRGRANWAEIVYPPEVTAFGTRRRRARVPEGREWSFGTCAPFTLAPEQGGG